MCCVSGIGVPKEVLHHELTDKNLTWLGMPCLFLFLINYFMAQILFL